MNGCITIDGYCKGHYEIVKHGGQPNPEALCSLVYRIDRNVEVLELLKIMQSSIQNAINAEFDAMLRQKGGIENYVAEIEDRHRHSWKESLKRSLEEEGHEPLSDKVLDCIVREIEFQEAGMET